jgi:hypothetical protein
MNGQFQGDVLKNLIGPHEAQHYHRQLVDAPSGWRAIRVLPGSQPPMGIQVGLLRFRGSVEVLRCDHAAAGTPSPARGAGWIVGSSRIGRS